MNMEKWENGVLETAKLILTKRVNAVEVTKAALRRIKETAEYHTMITVEEEGALQRAAFIQQAVERGEKTGLLCGVPMVGKDNLCSRGIRTTCGSKMLEHFIPTYSAFALERLEESGAILLGKSNMDEFAMGSTTETSYFGSTGNAYDPMRTAGGSSGGSACSVALRQCSFALGSDTGGSIRLPAMYNGIYGLKPTYGRVSRYGLIAYGSSLDQIGPMARTPRDLLAVYSVIARYDRRDSTCVRKEDPWLAGFREIEDFSDEKRIGTNQVKGMRIGVLTGSRSEGITEEMQAELEKTVKRLEELGCVAERAELPLMDYGVPAYYLIACAEASSNLERYDGVKYGYRPEQYADLNDLYQKARSEGFGEECKRRILLGTYALSEGMYEQYYRKAAQVRRKLQEAMQQLFTRYDVLLLPVAGSVAPKWEDEPTDPLQIYRQDVFTVPANLTGMPAMAIPGGKNREGLPMGFQVMADLFAERKLFALADAYHQAVVSNQV